MQRYTPFTVLYVYFNVTGAIPTIYISESPHTIMLSGYTTPNMTVIAQKGTKIGGQFTVCTNYGPSPKYKMERTSTLQHNTTQIILYYLLSPSLTTSNIGLLVLKD